MKVSIKQSISFEKKKESRWPGALELKLKCAKAKSYVETDSFLKRMPMYAVSKIISQQISITYIELLLIYDSSLILFETGSKLICVHNSGNNQLVKGTYFDKIAQICQFR